MIARGVSPGYSDKNRTSPEGAAPNCGNDSTLKPALGQAGRGTITVTRSSEEKSPNGIPFHSPRLQPKEAPFGLALE